MGRFRPEEITVDSCANRRVVWLIREASRDIRRISSRSGSRLNPGICIPFI